MFLKLSVIATILSLSASAVTAEHSCYRSSPIPGHIWDWQLHTYPVPNCHHQDSKGHKVHSTVYHGAPPPKGPGKCYPIKTHFESFSYTTFGLPGQQIQLFSETGCKGAKYTNGNPTDVFYSIQNWQNNHLAHEVKSFKIVTVNATVED
ncbi:hypothetical protein BJ138DRAFT_1167865 [Hygrophoropsis aurantiaca]|uniref:Uncharacterized protein n=1 Tax=Hygrophoropsis aurantiaca TaxID=72124 RepID=A0ACB7ZS76_9AGAM|nr:hypothetical protein BJ138DRAFT_1167865 [Hygrophoropsis aurantiaca]